MRRSVKEKAKEKPTQKINVTNVSEEKNYQTWMFLNLNIHEDIANLCPRY